MNKKDLIQQLELTFVDIEVNTYEKDVVKIYAKKEQVGTIIRYLKDNEYDHLALISCVDWIKNKEFKLIYILSSYSDNYESYKKKGDIYLKTKISRANPEIESVINVFENAEPYEREIHELFGIEFSGHPRLIPLFLERKYKVPPFRKDFDTRKYVEDVFNSIPVIPEEKK
jgi:NADH-quinone oxidoreductase subunit C